MNERAQEIWDLAQSLGLDPLPTHFTTIAAERMYEYGAYGIPGRFGHWSFGKMYHRMLTEYQLGMSKIYELVINSDPAEAFLLESNSEIENMLVMAHVLGHTDFFHRSIHFASSHRGMIQSSQSGSLRIERYEEQYGPQQVEQCLDAALALSDHVAEVVQVPSQKHFQKKRSFDYADLFPDSTSVPTIEKRQPSEDLLGFLLHHAPLEDWQKDVLTLVREEALYLQPQMRTKILNEGWASFWHRQIMRELPLSSAETIEFAKLHAAVTSPNPYALNPYHLGLFLLDSIDQISGRNRLFAIRDLEDDISFLRNYLSTEHMKELHLYLYKATGTDATIVETELTKVVQSMIRSRIHRGVPLIEVVGDNAQNQGILELTHCHDGRDLDPNHAEKTLSYVTLFWKRPVWLYTEQKGRKVILKSTT